MKQPFTFLLSFSALDITGEDLQQLIKQQGIGNLECVYYTHDYDDFPGKCHEYVEIIANVEADDVAEGLALVLPKLAVLGIEPDLSTISINPF
jgi:hypothetical protein